MAALSHWKLRIDKHLRALMGLSQVAQDEQSHDDDIIEKALVILWDAANQASTTLKREFSAVAGRYDPTRSEIEEIMDDEFLTLDDRKLSALRRKSDARLFEMFCGAIGRFEGAYLRRHDGIRKETKVPIVTVKLGGAEHDFHVFRSRRRGSWKPSAGSKPTFEKGVLTGLRIVPAVIDDLTVSVECIRPSDLREFDIENPIRFAGCTFDNFTLGTKKTQTGFCVVTADAKDKNQQIEDAIRSAVAQECHLLVFPELTIDPDSITLIRTMLAKLPLEQQAPVVVAGSWHHPENGSFINKSVVLDGESIAPITYNKRLPFRYVSDDEDIIKGQSLLLLECPFGILTVAICLDFCDKTQIGNFVALDPDFAIVPSFGNAQTLQGHHDTAKSLYQQRSCRTFVVQQLDPTQIGQGGLTAHGGYVHQSSSEPSIHQSSAPVCVWSSTTNSIT
ncbi:hypothetical protein [Thalassospira xiamenensis]|uniref:CN hydrolase domain-containing protein n=1 Tax=Thalassospira xiamenensis TaxID=220697 RepID=A0A285TYH1_9PROT|nr:hypothetical protein [Thalassospira xiamenensis]SOC27494.1 hypothetical protein SAMN05428964_105438 [Thalassospira xiamenensis]